MTTKVYNGGTWKDITSFYVRNNNTWQEADTVYKKSDGNWKVIYDKGPYNWSGASVSGLGIADFGDSAYASGTFYNTGEFVAFGSPYGIGEDTYSYSPSSKVSSLEIMYNVSSPPPQLQGDSVNMWLPLSSTRYWAISLPAGIVNLASVTGTILIRRNDLLVMSGTLTLSADVISIG